LSGHLRLTDASTLLILQISIDSDQCGLKGVWFKRAPAGVGRPRKSQPAVHKNEETHMPSRRDFIKSLPVTGTAFAVASNVLLEGGSALAQAAAPAATPHPGHFHPKGKAPSPFTVDVLHQARAGLPFGDRRDLTSRKRA
jgi:hypothetical protein